MSRTDIVPRMVRPTPRGLAAYGPLPPVAAMPGRGIVVGLLAVTVLAVGPFVLPGGVIAAILTAGVYVPAALGLVVLVGRTGLLSLGHGPLVGLGAYSYFHFADRVGIPSLGALAIAIAITSLLALMTAPILRLSGLTFALATLALGFILVQLFGNLDRFTGGPSGLTNVGVRPSPFTVGPVEFTSLTMRWYLVASIGGLIALGCANLLRSRVGRSLDLVAEDPDAAATMGIDVFRTKVRVWVLAGALAGASGALHISHARFAAPSQFGLYLSALLIAAVVVGGTRSLGGAALALVAFFAAIELLPMLEASGPMLAGLIIVVVVLLREYRTGRRSPVDPEAIGPPRQPASEAALTAEPTVPREAARTGGTLRASEVSVSFGGIHALQGVSLELQPGRITGLIGPNGAGKSTLINAFTGMVALQEGTIHLDDTDVTLWPAPERVRSGLRRTYQNIRLVPEMTVRQNVELGGHVLGSSGFLGGTLASPRDRRDRTEITKRAELEMARWALSSVADVPAAQLPAGTRRLLEVARACMTSPRVLLLDEPAAGLNDVETERLAELVRKVASEGTTVLLVEHDLPLVMRLCDHVLVLAQGQLLAAGTPSEVVADPSVRAVYIGDTDADRH